MIIFYITVIWEKSMRSYEEKTIKKYEKRFRDADKKEDVRGKSKEYYMKARRERTQVVKDVIKDILMRKRLAKVLVFTGLAAMTISGMNHAVDDFAQYEFWAGGAGLMSGFILAGEDRLNKIMSRLYQTDAFYWSMYKRRDKEYHLDFTRWEKL
jgi:hypothetical protein